MHFVSFSKSPTSFFFYFSSSFSSQRNRTFYTGRTSEYVEINIVKTKKDYNSKKKCTETLRGNKSLLVSLAVYISYWYNH